jgi:hypothetical protein
MPPLATVARQDRRPKKKVDNGWRRNVAEAAYRRRVRYYAVTACSRREGRSHNTTNLDHALSRKSISITMPQLLTRGPWSCTQYPLTLLHALGPSWVLWALFSLSLSLSPYFSLSKLWQAQEICWKMGCQKKVNYDTCLVSICGSGFFTPEREWEWEILREWEW